MTKKEIKAELTNCIRCGRAFIARPGEDLCVQCRRIIILYGYARAPRKAPLPDIAGIPKRK